MKGHCGECDWWDSEHPRLRFAPAVPGIEKPGFCRKHKPGAYLLSNYWIGIQPIMDSMAGCGEFRERKAG